jgi:hypothetical protein
MILSFPSSGTLFIPRREIYAAHLGTGKNLCRFKNGESKNCSGSGEEDQQVHSLPNDCLTPASLFQSLP